MIRPCLLSLLLASPLAAQEAAPNPSPTEDPRAQAVMLRISFKNGDPQLGTGILLCQVADRAFLLTARHVIAPTERRAEEIRIEFFQGTPEAVRSKPRGDLLAVRQAEKGLDLVLIEVRLDPTLPATVRRGRPPTTQEIAESPPRVRAIGWRTGEGDETWSDAPGELVGWDGEFLYHSAGVTGGFSGGPLFDEAGAWIGVNLEIAPGWEVPGGDSERSYGRALPVERTYPLLFKWTPAACWGKAWESVEVAHERYRRGLRALNSRKWRRAEALFREAIEIKPQEGGVVHLTGMRYTDYLPHFHLGLAMYKDRENGQRCEETLDELYLSTTHAAIRNNRRFGQLERLRKRCHQQLAERRRLVTSPASTPSGGDER